MQVQFLEASPKAATSHSLQDLSGCLSQYPCCREGGRAPEQGFPAAPSEGQGMTAAFCWGRLQGCEGRCAARGAQGRPSELGPCTPGGCVLGQGLCHLPGSPLSLPGELPTALRGEAVGGRSDPRQDRTGQGRAGQGPSAVERVLRGSGLLPGPHHH